MELEALIFDVGNVLLTYDPEELRAVYAGRYQDYSHLPIGYVNWPQLELYVRGRVTTAEFVRHLEGLTKRRIDPEGFDSAWSAVFHVNERLVQLIPALRRKYKLAILSNTIDSHWRCCKEKLAPIIDYFDVVVLSFEVNLLKPEPEIFLKTAALLGQPPERCLLIDDTQGHVLAARAAGFPAICYKEQETESFLLSLL